MQSFAFYHLCNVSCRCGNLRSSANSLPSGNACLEFFWSTSYVLRSPFSLRDLWGDWCNKKSLISFWNLFLKAVMWNILIGRNNRIFTATCFTIDTIIVKIIHMVLMWMNAVPESKKPKLEHPMGKSRGVWSSSLHEMRTRVSLGRPSTPPSPARASFVSWSCFRP